MKESFNRWIPMHRLCIADMERHGNFPAVYAIRNCTTKDVLKYGHTKQLRQRIFLNFICGWGGNNPQATTQRVYAELLDNDMIECVELAWIPTENKAEAARMESKFRREYMDAHGGQRPLWDRQN